MLNEFTIFFILFQLFITFLLTNYRSVIYRIGRSFIEYYYSITHENVSWKVLCIFPVDRL